LRLQLQQQDLKDIRINAISQIAGAIAGMFERGSAAYIAFFALEKAMAIAQVWMSYAKESAAHHAVAATMGPAGIAYDAAMQAKALTTAGVNTGIIVAQAIAQVAGGKKAKTYAEGKYPVTAEDGETYNAKWAGRPKTGYYDGPHLGVFNEVPGRREMVIDGITNRNIELNYPEIRDAIFAVRDGFTPNYARNLKGYSDGKYPKSEMLQNLQQGSSINSATGQLVADAVLQLKDEIKRFQQWKPKVYTEMIKKDLEYLDYIEKHRGL